MNKLHSFQNKKKIQRDRNTRMEKQTMQEITKTIPLAVESTMNKISREDRRKEKINPIVRGPSRCQLLRIWNILSLSKISLGINEGPENSRLYFTVTMLSSNLALFALMIH